MIRRDYLLRMIEEFCQFLRRLNSLKREQQWNEAAGQLEQEFRRLVGADAEEVAQLSETELLARIIHGESTLAVRDKTLMLTTLLKESGDIAVAQGRAKAGHTLYLKGLHLLLENPLEDDTPAWLEVVPKIEAFLEGLHTTALPRPTLAMLMHHYERTVQFGKAEDALFSMLELEPSNPAIVQFGLSFYERLQHQTDVNLMAGNLPRTELEAGSLELRKRHAALNEGNSL